MADQDKYSFARVLETLTSSSKSLKALAVATGFDPFSFYQKADLSGLDLSGQDLRGLNFNGAILRGVSGINFEADLGAFNGCITDNADLLNRTDQYEYFLEDVLHPQARFLYAFAEFRPGAIDACMLLFGTPLSQLAEAATLSTATVRKARRTQVVALESAAAIAAALGEYAKSLVLTNEQAAFVRQPMISVLELPYDKPFGPIKRERFARLLELSELVNERRGTSTDGTMVLFRDGPNILEWLAKYYEQGREPDWSAYRPVTRDPGPLFSFADELED